MLITWGQLLGAQTPELTVPSPGDLSDFEINGESGVLYDAKTIGFDKDGRRYLFEGDVVLIGGGYVITADTVEVEYFKKELVAKGHVLFINDNQIFTGDKVFIRWQTGDFTIDAAMLVANDPKQVTEAARRILGQSPEELAYVAARESRLAEIGKRKGELREEFRQSKGESPSPEVLGAYTRLLSRSSSRSQAKRPTKQSGTPRSVAAMIDDEDSGKRLERKPPRINCRRPIIFVSRVRLSVDAMGLCTKLRKQPSLPVGVKRTRRLHGDFKLRRSRPSRKVTSISSTQC
jgi:hypothetical protein